MINYISKIVRKSTNLAVLSEFSRYPLCIKVITNTCNFLKRLHTTNLVFLQGAYKESSLIATPEKVSWMASVEFI